jgi:type IV pilus assembly protein PilM
MAKAKAAWGIEVGSAAIKAVRLERDGTEVRVADFIVIPHPKVLTTPDLNVEEMLRISLGAFTTQKSVEGAAVLMSVPGNEGLARFAKLPPIPKKAVPQTVLFEAKQQIPFPLEEVEWDYHLFASDDSPEYEVGIFAILKEKIAQRLGLYKELGLRPSGMTLGPVAVYNAMMFDRDLDKGGKPVLAFLDIGTRATDLVVIEEGRCWIRTFPIGGHHFTEAIASAFSVPYGKADRLKAEAATHKYAKQLMHAMKPVFDDLLQEVQRSMGHYQSLHPDKPVTQVIGLGSTFRIPGLRKFLSDQLQVEIRRLEEFEKIKVEGSAATDFSANAMNLSTAIGLALQGIGYSEIGINLSPVGNLREQVWRKKGKWFAIAAVLVCAASAALFYRAGGSVGNQVPGQVSRVKNEAEGFTKEFESAKQAADLGARANNMIFMLEDRRVWPWIVSDVNAAIASAGAQEALLDEFDVANPPVKYEEWKTVELSSLGGRYKFVSGTTPKRTVEVTMQVVVPRDEKGAKEFVQGSILDWLNKNADRKEAPYVIVIPEKGIVPTFSALGDKSADGTSSTQAPIATEEAAPEETSSTTGGAGTVSGRNKTSETYNRSGGQLGGSGFGGAGGTAPSPDDPQFTGATGGSSGGAKKDRKATRVAVKSAAAEPVDIDRDASIPSAPRPYAGRPATSVTVKFTVELRPPVGRDLAPAAGGGEGESPEGMEGEQQ